MEPANETESKLLQELVAKTNQVLQYELFDAQNLALEQLPLDQLTEKASRRAQASKTEGSPCVGEDDFLILELLHWFKFTFFSWVDKLKCDDCGEISESRGLVQPSSDDRQWGVSRVESYFCIRCQKNLRFPRYNHPKKLLETRRGRCGEWANCFALFCRSLGYDVRLVFDWNDHVWTEVYSQTQKRWLHCDPCENVCDKPLMYELGWKKSITYVLGFSKDEVQDVTWRYCTQFRPVLAKRRQYRESWLSSSILSLNNSLQALLSEERRQEILVRKVCELCEFLMPSVAKTDEMSGRSSGSKAWRELRGEYHPDFECPRHVFQLSREEISKSHFNVKYSCSMNKYIRGSDNLLESNGWESLVYESSDVFRKVENDWNMSYLSRAEDSEHGLLTWKFDFKDTGLVINILTATLTDVTFENGDVQWVINTEDIVVPLRGGGRPVIVDDLHGHIEFSLSVRLSGGRGSVAWQHAQLFRQPLDSQEFPFEIDVTFIPRSTAL